MSSSSDKTKRKQGNNFCSTPVLGHLNQLSSIELSTINTGSSSTKESVLKEKCTRTQRYQKKKQKKQVGRIKVKRRKKKECRTKKETKSFEQTTSDENWETYEESKRQITEVEQNPLFNDIRSPERIREASLFLYNRLDSPIFKPREGDVSSPDDILKKKDECLPVRDHPFTLPSVDIDEDDEDDEIHFSKENAQKTYANLNNKKQKKTVEIDKSKKYLVDFTGPTLTSDRLWESFVAKNYESVKKYLAPKNTSDKNIESDEPRIQIDDSSEDDIVIDIREDIREMPTKESENTIITRGYWNISSREFVRFDDVYTYQGEKEINEECQSVHNVRLNEYLTKKRMKRNINKDNELDSFSSYSTHEQNLPWQRYGDLESKLNRQFVKSCYAVAREIYRIPKACNFASPSNVKEKKITANDMSASTSKDTRLNYSISKSKTEKFEHEDDRGTAKKRKMVKIQGRPRIRSIDLLQNIRYQRNGNSWQIVKAMPK